MTIDDKIRDERLQSKAAMLYYQRSRKSIIIIIR